MPSISTLTAQQRSTVYQLANGIDVPADRITGLLDSIKTRFYQNNPNVRPMNWSYGTTEINGMVPPGQLMPLQDPVQVVDKVVGNQRVSVSLGTRLAGTRVGIHVHQYGGTTFVVGGKGRINDFVQNMPGSVNRSDWYYYMPANIPMTATNISTRDARLMDVFVVPAGQPLIDIIEPGYP